MPFWTKVFATDYTLGLIDLFDIRKTYKTHMSRGYLNKIQKGIDSIDPKIYISESVIMIDYSSYRQIVN